ncbi:Transcriptional regulatory protein YpdB [Arenibacter antarcticus]|uniref:LytR/AlgR family response regulator transcription factor n=1 Tax=Arenibacter antarcticus TaxID=2040469 RepID=A0ABW5VFJ2_9FLAO|nr:LytTR family DNA-binding domain-containing protein [Arenibacter sp. H213]MCM4168207.1 DNA-binding response regulator [Arenibacter sp. H213]
MKSSKLKCILIDDSAIQRRAISKLIKENKSLVLLHEFGNGEIAKDFLALNVVDLIFLDIEMPLISGFDLLESLDEKPQIIVISGSAEHAMKAFDYDVADYLKKPLDKKRFDNAVKKAAINHKIVNTEEIEQEFIYINHQLKKTKLILNEILWVEANGDYIKIISKERNMLILSTMKAFADNLPSDKFLRIHKSFIVNLDKIDKFNGSSVEIDGKVIPLSRHKKELLKKALIIIE